MPLRWPRPPITCTLSLGSGQFPSVNFNQMQSENILTHTTKPNLLTCPAVRRGVGVTEALVRNKGGQEGGSPCFAGPTSRSHDAVSTPGTKNNSSKTKQNLGILVMNRIYTNKMHSSMSRTSGQIPFSTSLGLRARGLAFKHALLILLTQHFST